MAIFVTVLQIVAPVFFLAFIGFCWVRLGYDYNVQFVTRLAMTISVPALIFVSLMKTEIEQAVLVGFFWASCATYLALTLAFYLVVKIGKLDQKTFLAPLIFGNTGNLGIPLALFAFGEAGLGYAVVIFALMAIYSFTFGIWLVSGGGSPLKIIKEPMVGATLLGAVFLMNGWQTPAWVTNTLELIGQMAIPLMLLTLGVALARLKPKGVNRAIILSLVRVVICGILAWAIGSYFDLNPIAKAVLIVQASTPVAVSSYLIAEKYGAASEDVAGLVVISTILSIFTLPLVLAFVV